MKRHAAGNLIFTVFPLWVTTESLPGRLCPFISSDQIFTVCRMACLASRSPFFPGQVLNRLGQFVLHSAGAGPRPAQRAHVGVSKIFPQKKLAPLSLNLRRACGIHIFDLMRFHPQLQRTSRCLIYEWTRACLSHVDSVVPGLLT